MFWTLIDTITEAFMDLAEMIFDIFDKIGAISFIITLTVIGMFIAFIIFNHVGLASKIGSDRAKRRE